MAAEKILRNPSEQKAKEEAFELEFETISKNLYDPDFGKNAHFNVLAAFREEIESLIESWEETYTESGHGRRNIASAANKIILLIQAFAKRAKVENYLEEIKIEFPLENATKAQLAAVLHTFICTIPHFVSPKQALPKKESEAYDPIKTRAELEALRICAVECRNQLAGAPLSLAKTQSKLRALAEDSRYEKEFEGRTPTPTTQLKKITRQLTKKYTRWNNHGGEKILEIEAELDLLKSIFPVYADANLLFPVLLHPKFDALRGPIDYFKNRIQILTKIALPTNLIVAQIEQDMHSLYLCTTAITALETAEVFSNIFSYLVDFLEIKKALLKHIYTPFHIHEIKDTQALIHEKKSGKVLPEYIRRPWFIRQLESETISLQKAIKTGIQHILDTDTPIAYLEEDTQQYGFVERTPIAAFHTPYKKIDAQRKELQDLTSRLFCEPHPPVEIAQQIVQKIERLLPFAKKAESDFAAFRKIKADKTAAKKAAREASIKKEYALQENIWRKYDIVFTGSAFLSFLFFSSALICIAALYSYCRAYPSYKRPTLDKKLAALEKTTAEEVTLTPEELAALKIEEEPQEKEEKRADLCAPEQIVQCTQQTHVAVPEDAANAASASPARAKKMVTWSDTCGQFWIPAPSASKKEPENNATVRRLAN